LSKIRQSSKKEKKKWIRTTLWVIGMAVFTLGLFYLVWFLRSQLSVSLKQYDILAYLIVFGGTFLASCTIILPAPGAALVITAASIWNPVIVALVASAGSALGEITGYFAGYIGEKIIIDEQKAAYLRATSWMKRYGMWAVFVVSVIPFVLFDIIGLVAGALKLPLWRFLLACWLGRIPKSFIEAYIGAGLIPHFFPSWFL
jgi:uncharacterized membrane protein YdjX (TVP38/TMEM64 family)